MYYIAMRLFETASLPMHDSCIYKGKSKIFLGISVWRQEGSPGLQPAARKAGDDADPTQLSSCAAQSWLGYAAVAFAFPSCPAGAWCYEMEVLGNLIQKAFVSKSRGALCSGNF